MKTLVLLHGWGASGRLWRGVQAAAACDSARAVLTPEIPRWEAGWLAQYLSGLPLKESVLVGWSLGGMLLLEALAQLRGRRPAPRFWWPCLRSSAGGRTTPGASRRQCYGPCAGPWGAIPARS